MKKTIAYLFAALAIVTAASCTKDEQLNNDEQSGSRVIELTFDNGDATKVGVSDRTPKWEDGDQIWLSDGTNSETVTLTESDIDKTNNIAKITTTLSGTLYAVYPASAQNGVSGDDEEKQIGFKIPTSTDGAFGKAHISVAKGETSLAFKNVVSILKITTEAVTKIVNISSTSKIAGEFKVTYSTLAIAAGTNQADGINVTSSAAGDKYVAVASGIAFNALDFTVVNGATDWASKKSTNSTLLTAIKTIYNMGSVADWSLTYSTNGSLWAKFSVSASTKVRFSKGNLQYQAGNGTTADPKWRFAANQYDIIGDADGNNTATGRDTQSAWIDLFGWGATGQNSNGQKPYSISTKDRKYKTLAEADGGETLTIANKADWGYCMGGESSVWRTLSGEDSGGEWEYLLSTRTVNGGTGEGKSYQRATINSDATGVYGMIIYPDGYTSQTSGISYTSSEWATMEEAGCVFLPAAGFRCDSSITDVGDVGYYWSSTAYTSDDAYGLYFDGSYVSPASDYGRYSGISVRLVSAAQ